MHCNALSNSIHRSFGELCFKLIIYIIVDLRFEGFFESSALTAFSEAFDAFADICASSRRFSGGIEKHVAVLVTDDAEKRALIFSFRCSPNTF